MSGEITSHGKVLPVGGLKEKCIAADKSGIKLIILPKANEIDIKQEIPEEIKKKVEFKFVEKIEEVIKEVF